MIVQVSNINKRTLFAISFLLSFLILLTMAFVDRPKPRAIELHRLTPDIFVTEQIELQDFPLIKSQQVATIIDIRPDGEQANQVPSGTVEAVARANNMSFAYVPVNHGTIPNSAVIALTDALASNPKPILLYCRSGRRAARTFGLAEASRVGGPDAASILAMIHSAGQNADDLAPEINERIAHRGQPERQPK